ncbi:glycosyl transferase family protein [Reinekea blandensis]|uniref:Glycosyl transferase family 3 N-terminal domain-containing protein n=1 Tax=Reinekea blandensis MED297 TaxID=314283 RepID=A4BDR0_9GAMM|nr:glycosyl transferase family protein [Reinekea blandensis]EAR09669.1 hypothetical protein MED297_15959 [Reinekea blandensis MED297]
MTEQLSLPGLIRALGRGKKGSRNLTRAEAHYAMSSILDGTMTQAQLGALLMLMRVKEETPEEIAGLVDACHDALPHPEMNRVDVNWPAYAGKKKQPSWYLLAARLLADNGIRVLLHGGGEHTAGRQYARQICPLINIQVVDTLDSAADVVNQQGIAYIAVKDVLPVMSDLIDMKAELGLRSPVNTLVRHLNPLNARLTLQGMFHPPYMAIHHEAAILLGQQQNIVMKGDGGEFEVRPDSDTRIAVSDQSEPMTLPPVFNQRAVRPDQVQAEPLTELWNETEHNSYGEAAVCQTAALVLSQLEGLPIETAKQQTLNWWQNRGAL